jgi:hypothetical protein
MTTDQTKSFLADLQELMSKYDVRILRGSEEIDASPYRKTLMPNPVVFRDIGIQFTQVIFKGDKEWEEAMDYFNYGTKPEQLWEKKEL